MKKLFNNANFKFRGTKLGAVTYKIL